jgi:hypothetical protein
VHSEHGKWQEPEERIIENDEIFILAWIGLE